MADSIVITLDGVDNTSAAFSSASRNVDNFSNSVKKLGSDAFAKNLQGGGKFGNMLVDQAQKANFSSLQMHNLASATGMWSKSQIDAAGKASLMSQKAAQLTDAVKRGVITTDEAGRSFKNYERSLMTVGDRYQVVSQKLESFQSGMLKIGLAGAGVYTAGKAIYDLAESGAELEYTRVRFDRLAQAAGTTGDVFMSQLREATKGTVSDMQLAKNASDLFQLGLANTSEEAIRLSKVQTALGMDTGELTLALANQSKRRLDQLGLSLTKFNEIEAKLKASGMSKDAAFREAFMQTAEQTIVTTGNKADSTAGDFARLEAGFANMFDAGKLASAKVLAPTIRDVSMFATGMANLLSGNTVFDLSGGLGAPSWVRQATVQDKSALWDRSKQNQFGSVTARNGAVTGLSALQSYTAMAYQYGSTAQGGQGTPAGTTPPEVAAEVDYTKLLSGSMALTKQQASYKDSVDKIHNAYKSGETVRNLFKQDVAALRQELAQTGDYQNYYQKVGELQKAFRDGSYAAQKESEAINELNNQQQTSAQQFALNLMQQDEAYDPEKVYDFAAATGQITQAAAEQYKGIQKINKAYADGTINAEQAAEAITNVSGDVKDLGGMSVATYVDVFVRMHGSIPTDVVASTAPGGPDLSHRGSNYTNAARGGVLDGRQWTLVGDVPGGVTPYTEAISPSGVVYDAKMTKWMLESGFLDSAQPMASGSGLLGASAAGNLRRTGGRISRPVPVMSKPVEETQTTAVQTEVATLQTTVKELSDAVKQMTSGGLLPTKVAIDQSSQFGIGYQVGLQIKKITG